MSSNDGNEKRKRAENQKREKRKLEVRGQRSEQDGSGAREYPKLTMQWELLTASTILHLSASTVRKFPKYRNLDLQHLRFGPGSSLGHHDKSEENGNDESGKLMRLSCGWGNRKR